ncbi:MAG TPA: hypothetical protein PKD52_04680 [Clostridiales bacterium]|nr:hypothetical protein [Clostridiales bacterium]
MRLIEKHYTAKVTSFGIAETGVKKMVAIGVPFYHSTTKLIVFQF